MSILFMTIRKTVATSVLICGCWSCCYTYRFKFFFFSSSKIVRRVKKKKKQKGGRIVLLTVIIFIFRNFNHNLKRKGEKKNIQIRIVNPNKPLGFLGSC